LKIVSVLLECNKKATQATAFHIKLDVNRDNSNKETHNQLKELRSTEDLCRMALSKEIVLFDPSVKNNEVSKGLRR
jgi:hypothetical protein